MNTVNKQALLDWLNDRKKDSEANGWGSYVGYNKAIEQIQSGRFDSPDTEHEKAYWAREGLIKHQQAEIDRLRAALEKIAGTRMSQHMTVSHVVTFMHSVAVEALSTTTEPTGAERVRELLANPMAAGAYRAGVLDACKAFGINIPDKEDTNE